MSIAIPDPAGSEAAWAESLRATLGLYSEDLIRRVSRRLLKPRSQWPIDDLIQRSVETQSNAPVLDRRLADLPEGSRKALALIGVSGRPVWRVGHLLRALATLGHADGLGPVFDLLEAGLIFPEVPDAVERLNEFAEALNPEGTQHTRVFAHPFVAVRAASIDWGLPDLSREEPPAGLPHQSDGLDWPLRMAVAWQLSLTAGPFRLTQQQTLFKRDWQRLQTDRLLTSPLLELSEPLPDQGLFAFALGRACGLLGSSDGEIRAGVFPASWAAGSNPALKELWPCLFAVEDWDPLAGWVPGRLGDTPLPSLTPIVGLLLAALPAGAWAGTDTLADWLWERHPSWASDLNNEPDRGRAWLAALTRGVLGPLRLIESAGDCVRLSPLGRHLLRGEAEPPAPPEFRQSLTVQPTGELVVYRQGLNPELIKGLSHFAVWKSLGAACTLELQPEQVYLGLERGHGLNEILRFLQRHGTRETPTGVADLLRSWAGKRERISVYTSATLLEFSSAAELEEAMRRGAIEARVTDRIGLASGDGSIDWSHFRQTGNRDYESPLRECVRFAEDGVTFVVDAGASDLLLEAELPALADQLGGRNYRMTPGSLRRAALAGWSPEGLERWCRERGGTALPPAAMLLYPADKPPASAGREWVVNLADEATADGVAQWPTTAELIARRLGPTTLAVAEESLDALREALAVVGIRLIVGREGDPETDAPADL